LWPGTNSTSKNRSYTMKRLSTLIMGLALTAVLTSAAQAQAPATPPTPQQQAEGLTNKMKTQLKLSDAQVQQVGQINLQTMLKVDSLKAGGGRKLKEDKHLKQAMDDQDAALKKVLTGDQYAGWQTMQAQMKQSK
jgi:hypothetical protein